MATESLKNLVYNEILYTPGYRVDFAVGTTYSLDMEALLLVPAAFGMLGDGNDVITENRAQFLEAIRQSSSKLAVFYNSGRFTVPKKDMAIYPLLENSIFPVSQIGSFHPKIWVIKETDIEDGTSQIKVISTSRNLSTPDFIEIAIVLTGKIDGDKSHFKKHQPLMDFLGMLSKNYCHNGDKRKKIRQLINDISNVGHFDVDPPFDDYDFIPLSPMLERDWTTLSNTIQGNAVVTVSPFLDDSQVELLTARSKKENSILITRNDMVDVKTLDRFGQVLCVNDELINGELGSINLHAKMYLSYLSDEESYLFIGSTNATTRAFNMNTEFLLRLHYMPHKGRQVNFMEMINGDKQFVPVTTPSCEVVKYETDSEEEMALKSMLKAVFRAKVFPGEADGRYKLQVTIKPRRVSVPVFLAPLQNRGQRVCIENSDGFTYVEFDNLKLHQISEFYILSAGMGDNKVSTIIKVHTFDIPEDRDKLIFQSIIDTPEKFIEYISIKFCDDPANYLFQLEQQKKFMQTDDKASSSNIYTSLYEDMVRNIYDDPDNMDDVDDIIVLFGERVPQEFKTMYETFKKTAKTLKKWNRKTFKK